MNDLLHLQALMDRIATLESRLYGKYPAFLVDNLDPQGRGRLKVQIPDVLGGEVISGWAEPCVPYGGGDDFGTFSIPPVTTSGEGVYTTGIWVEFRGGDPRFPIWVGTFWGDPGGTPEAPADGDQPDVDVHVRRTFSGHSLLAVDKVGTERLELSDTANQRLVMSSPLREGVKRDAEGRSLKKADAVTYEDLLAESASIELVDFAQNTLRLDGTKDASTVTLINTTREGSVLQTVVMSAADSAIVITDQKKNTITLNPDGITIDSPENRDRIVLNKDGITATGPQITVISSDGDVNITSSANVSVKGSASVSVEGSNDVAIKGSAQVKISSSGKVVITGGMVSIN